MNRFLATAFFLGLMILVSGCGYRLQGTGKADPHGVHSLAIPVVGNVTTRTDLTYALSNDLVDEFSRSKIYSLASSDQADAILEVKVVSMETLIAAREKDAESSSARRVVVAAEATMRKRGTGQVLWQSGRVTARKTFPVTNDQIPDESSLSLALKDISYELAEKIHRWAIEDF